MTTVPYFCSLFPKPGSWGISFKSNFGWKLGHDDNHTCTILVLWHYLEGLWSIPVASVFKSSMIKTPTDFNVLGRLLSWIEKALRDDLPIHKDVLVSEGLQQVVWTSGTPDSTSNTPLSPLPGCEKEEGNEVKEEMHRRVGGWNMNASLAHQSLLFHASFAFLSESREWRKGDSWWRWVVSSQPAAWSDQLNWPHGLASLD